MKNTLTIALLLLMSATATPSSEGKNRTRVNKTKESIARFDTFRETSLTSVVPQGWLREFLLRQNSGLTGHRAVLSYPFDTCMWAGQIGDRGTGWWPYEQTAYLSDGMIRLAYELGNKKLLREVHEGVSYVLAHPMENGRLGRPNFSSQWPLAVYFRVLQAEYLATGDPKVLEALRKHYLSYTVEELTNSHRHIVNIEGMLWTYGKTGDPKLLQLAEKAYAWHDQHPPDSGEVTMSQCLSDKKIVTHGVTYLEESKLPAILYAYTGKKQYLNAAVNAMKKIDRDYMLPDGVPSSNEYLSSKDPVRSHETCDITDYTWSAGYLLMATGDATWADHIEKAIFNAGPGCVSKDFKNLQYFSSPNQVIATGDSNVNNGSVGWAYGGNWMAFWPCHDVECCAGSVHRFMPNYAARMWMSGKDGGVVAALYGPSTEKVAVNGGKTPVTITEATNYPFSDTVTFSFSMSRAAKFPFGFRIPAWCSNPSVKVNGKPVSIKLTPGTFATLNRQFKNGDKVQLRLPMTAKLGQWGEYGVTVERGPLLYAYPVAEKVAIDTKTYPTMGGKKTPDPVNFPALDIRPNGPWNYALAVDATNFASKAKVVLTGASGYPYDPATVPVVIKVPARRVKGWTLREGRYTPDLPATGKFECEDAVEMITLVPYGSTRLRMTVFPQAK